MEATPQLQWFEAFGIELEYMIVDRATLDVKPLADRLLRQLGGRDCMEVERGAVAWSNELARHVVEVKTNGPRPDLERAARDFDEAVRETISGVVTYWSFSNPHSFIDIDVTAADGSVNQHKIFLTSRVVLQRYGWRPDSLTAGDEIEVEGSPDRGKPLEMYLQRIRFADGTEWRRSDVAE